MGGDTVSKYTGIARVEITLNLRVIFWGNYRANLRHE
ncbi:hypothetical protein SPLC1_S032840 [Arthrospira platensis C1]|nr:hypothetical protein SPLC1_S032840 [Arthrospira platensis C1]